MNSTEIILLPYIEEFAARVSNVIRDGHTAVICGGSGSGVSIACAASCSKWASRENGRHVRIPQFHDNDCLKLTQNFALHILGDQMPSDYRVHNVSILWGMVGQKLQKSGVGMIVYDRADLAPTGFIDSMMTMTSECRLAGNPIGILLGMRKERRNPELFDAPSGTGIAFVGTIHALSAENVLSVLNGMRAETRELMLGIERNDSVAFNALKALAQLSEGNIFRLAQFAKYVMAEKLQMPVIAAQMEKLWKSFLGLESNHGYGSR